MANEATVFSLTTAEMATAVADRHGGDAVDVSTQDVAAVAADIDVGIYFLKAAYESAGGRNKLLRHIEILKSKIVESAWPAI